jgi:hypothetical protein
MALPLRGEGLAQGISVYSADFLQGSRLCDTLSCESSLMRVENVVALMVVLEMLLTANKSISVFVRIL